MIALTELSGNAIHVNCDLMERIEQVPDTMITLTTGRRIMVRETPAEVVDRFRHHKWLCACPPVVSHQDKGDSVKEPDVSVQQ